MSNLLDIQRCVALAIGLKFCVVTFWIQMLRQLTCNFTKRRTCCTNEDDEVRSQLLRLDCDISGFSSLLQMSQDTNNIKSVSCIHSTDSGQYISFSPQEGTRPHSTIILVSFVP